jgi:lysozyme
MSGPLAEAEEVAAELCRHFEGFRSKPYLCPAGYWTIGYGTVFKPDGTQVTPEHPPIDRQTANDWLLHELRHNYMASTLRSSPVLAVHPRRLGAITSFAYNLGNARYRASTLRRKINEQDWEGAKTELLRWTRGGGKILPGLVRRRQAEVALL